MTTYNDVFTSILAMDSYHRNYNQGVLHFQIASLKGSCHQR